MADGTFAERQVAILEVRTTAMESHVCHGNAAMMNIAVVVSVTRAADFPFHACCDVSPNLAGRTTGVKASTVARYHRMLSCALNPERETVRACQGALDRDSGPSFGIKFCRDVSSKRARNVLLHSDT